MLNREEIRQRVKDAKKILSDELRNSKKVIKHDAWNTNNKIDRPKETSMRGNKDAVGIEDSKESDCSDNIDD